MADPSRTEKATPRRRKKAREEGSILKVPDLDAAVMLWGNLFLLLALGASTLALMARSSAYFFRRSSEAGILSLANLHALGLDILNILARVLLPFLAVNWLLALANQVVQHGFHISFKPMKPRFTKLNPASGFKRLFSARSAVDLFKSLAKLVVITWMAYAVVGPRMPAVLSTMHLSMSQAMGYLQETLFILYRNTLIFMLLVAGADFLWQRHSYEKSLRMTKQEVKDEMRQVEGDPRVKARLKSLMRQLASRRMMAAVPQADVVITNPTHLAVALKYDSSTMIAPLVVAKGRGFVALKIMALAREAGVPRVENRELARSLFRSVEVGGTIPTSLSRAAAEVLAYIYSLKAASGGAR